MLHCNSQRCVDYRWKLTSTAPAVMRPNFNSVSLSTEPPMHASAQAFQEWRGGRAGVVRAALIANKQALIL